MIDYCSPKTNFKKIDQICFSITSLNKLIKLWNINNIDNKIVINKDKITKKYLFNKLDIKLKKKCGKGAYWFWTDILEKQSKDNKEKYILKKIALKELKPKKPLEWIKNPRTWLSNYDIQNVMRQYDTNKKYKYSFLGVFPIDFYIKNKNGECIFDYIKKININTFINAKKQYIGLITNLDKHNQPGSHWTSTFIVINPKLKAYGAYYYDSTGRDIPIYLKDFFNDFKKQCESLYKNRPFNIIYTKKQHQFKNSECGVFSLLFQIRWINKHIIKKNNVIIDEIIANKDITDDEMVNLRDVLFRPNIVSISKQ